MVECDICLRELDVAGDPTTANCGGSCLRCMAEVGEDPNAIRAMQEITNPLLLCVAVYLEDRRYGGPEEGGWYYEAGELVTDAAFYRELGRQPATYLPDDQAVFQGRTEMEHALEIGPNKGRRSTGSVLSTGRYVARIEDFPPPLRYPAERPIYE